MCGSRWASLCEWGDWRARWTLDVTWFDESPLHERRAADGRQSDRKGLGSMFGSMDVLLITLHYATGIVIAEGLARH
jgi:hypothetical protein